MMSSWEKRFLTFCKRKYLATYGSMIDIYIYILRSIYVYIYRNNINKEFPPPGCGRSAAASSMAFGDIWICFCGRLFMSHAFFVSINRRAQYISSNKAWHEHNTSIGESGVASTTITLLSYYCVPGKFLWAKQMSLRVVVGELLVVRLQRKGVPRWIYGGLAWCRLPRRRKLLGKILCYYRLKYNFVVM